MATDEQPNEDLEKRFTYHKPKEDQTGFYEEIRKQAKTYSYFLDNVCPNSREKSLALTHLEEVVFWANASIARNRE